MTRAIRPQAGLACTLLTCALLTWAGVRLVAADSDSKPSKEPPGLMVHVPLDGAFSDARALGAVRPEALGDPRFFPGAVGEGALPAAGQDQVGLLHVTRLSRLMLRGKTPAKGTIMTWCRLDAPDSTRGMVLGSDSPLSLEVTVGGHPAALSASFADKAGMVHALDAPLPDLASGTPGWVHVALGWDSGAGTVIAFAGGLPIARIDGSPYEMPGLPKQFQLGNPRMAIDDFRLYDRLLDPAQLAVLPAIAPGISRGSTPR